MTLYTNPFRSNINPAGIEREDGSNGRKTDLRHLVIIVVIPIEREEDIERADEVVLDAERTSRIKLNVIPELRFDYNSEPMKALQRVPSLKRRVIITLRDRVDGGNRDFPWSYKAEFYRKSLETENLVDIEAINLQRLQVTQERVIGSVHYFSRLPSIKEVKELFHPLNTWALKLAVWAFPGYRELLTQSLSIFKNIAVVPMGTDPIERLDFAFRGSKLLYTHSGNAVVKGQMHYRDAIRELENRLLT